MALRTSDSKEEQDEAYNPANLHAAEQFPDAYSKSGVDQAEAFANDPENHDGQPLSTKKISKNDNEDSNSSRDAAKNQEENAGGWKNSFTKNDSAQNSGGRFSGVVNVAKKKGPMALIVTALLGGGGLFSLVSIPLLPIQFSETLRGSLNDQLTTMDLRTDKVLKARLSGLSPKLSSCGSVKIRCKFTTMSDKQVQQFKNAGFKDITTEKNGLTGRNTITGISTPDGVKITDPGHLTELAKSDPALRSALRKTYNPKFAGFSDSVAKKVYTKFKTDKSKKVVGNTDEERNKAVDNATAGDKAFTGLTDKGPVQDDNDGKGKYYTDSTGEKVYELDANKNPNPKFKEIADSSGGVGRINDSAKVGGHATEGVLKSGLKGISIIGYADTACTVYNTARAVAAAAKITRAVQLAQFAMVFFNTADAIKAGDAKPGDVEYVGKKLTDLDLNKTATDESSITGIDKTTGNLQTKDVSNSFYGKSALDSPGYKTAAYNEAPTLTSRSQQFMTGGGLVGTLSGVVDTIAGILNLGTAKTPKIARENIRNTCKTVQSWWARTAGLIAGLASAVGSFGILTFATVGASVAIGFATPFLEAQLADIIAGKVVGADTKNVAVGDAAFSGGGALMGDFAKQRGLKPANKASLKSYLAITDEVKSQDVAMETYEAKSTPFDVTKQYSFLGSLVRKVNPTIVESTGSIAAALTSIPSFLGAAFSSIIPQASADQVFNPDRFSKCPDPGYDDVGIDADVFCNVRYVLPTDELNMDSSTALNYMLDNQQINSDTGEAVAGSDYEAWQKLCTDRTAGWGESDNADDNNGAGLGTECMGDGPSGSVAFKYYRVYNIDNPINDGMDSEPDPSAQDGGTSTAATGGSTVSATAPEACKTLPADDLGQISCHSFKFDDYGYVYAGGHSGTAAAFMAKFNAGGFKAGTDAIVDCSGLVRMSIFDAFGVDVGDIATGNMLGNSNFTEIPKAQAGPGDILLRTGHTEIVVSNDVAAQKFQQFGAHTDNTAFPKQVGPASGTWGAWEHVLRFKKPGATVPAS
ncbi:MAG: hypothetical protein ABIQ04_04445 [Candidatus Saccharimonadales bacterium]